MTKYQNAVTDCYDRVDDFLNSSDFSMLHEMLTDDPEYKERVDKFYSLVGDLKKAVDVQF